MSELLNNASNIKNPRIRHELISYIFFQLDLKELMKFPKNDNAELVEILEYGDILEAIFLVNICDGKNTIISIIFNSKMPYPFYCPQIKILHYDYKSEILNTDISNFNLPYSCMCCSSVSCKGNWNLNFTLKEIIDEIKFNLSLKSRKVDLILCKKVVNNIFGTYVPIDTFL